MSHSVARHQDFKAVQPRDKVLVNVTAPDAFLPLELLVDVLYRFGKECPGSCGGVEDLNLMNLFLYLFPVCLDFDSYFTGIGNPFLQAKLGLKDVVNSPNDEVHDRGWRVIDPFGLTKLGVIFSEEGFVEVDYRVVLSGGFPEVFEYGRHIASPEHIGKVVNYPSYSTVKVIPGDRLEQLS